MKKKKRQAIKKVKEPKVLDIIVGKGFSLEEYATKGLSGDLRVEGYTFFLDEYDLVLPQQGNVEFVKCKFIPERMCLGSIVVNTRAFFTDCEFLSVDSQWARIMVHSEHHNTLLFRCCTGNNLLVAGGKEIEIIGCCLNHMHVLNLMSFTAVDLSVKYLSLENISTSVSLKKSSFLGLPDRQTPVLEMDYLMNTASVDIDASGIRGIFSVSRSALQRMSISDTNISTLMFHRATMYILSVDQMSKVDLITAKTSACESHLMHPSCPTLTAAYNSAGFHMCSPTIYKKVVLDRFGICSNDDVVDVILELKVPTYAQARYDEFSHKIRVSAAIPQKMYMIVTDKEGRAIAIEESKVPLLARLRSKYDSSFCYKIGKVAKPKQPFDMSQLDCASGIHGFLNPMEAAKY